ncbi:uncharacterized protein [Medicago truncatula]|nr:uncharacterized protein LOC11424795 isoform X2 [Medicago truncatula]
MKISKKKFLTARKTEIVITCVSHLVFQSALVIRDSQFGFLGALSCNIGHATPLEAEFCACMIAIEKAMELGLNNICLETDSLKVVNAFHKIVGIPWQMRVRWHNCIRFCHSIACVCVHIPREGNLVADALARHGQGLSLFFLQWWPAPPSFIQSFLAQDRYGMSSSRLNIR